MSSSACLNNILMRQRHCASKYYSVFLNFRGKDTRHNFVRPLHKALCLEGISAFKDDINLNKGNWIRRELFGAIEACRIAIVVLSKNYATSTWCLDELARIMKYENNNNNNRTIFPVFYDVCPSDVRHLRGSFAQAFNQHEVNHRIDPKKVKIWKQALRGAAEISGFELLNHVYKGDRSECIQDIVQEVRRKLKVIRWEEHKSVPTMEYHQAILKSLLRMGSSEDDLLFMRIWGSNRNTTIFIRKNFNKYCDHSEFKFGRQVSNSKKQGMNREKRPMFEIRQQQYENYVRSRQIPCVRPHLTLSVEPLNYRDLHPLTYSIEPGRGGRPLKLRIQPLAEEKKQGIVRLQRKIPYAHPHLTLSVESLNYRDLHPLTYSVWPGRGDRPLKLRIQPLAEEKKLGIVRLQRKFLENISKRWDAMNMIQGMRMIEPNFRFKKQGS